MSEIAHTSAASSPATRPRWRFSLRTIFLVILIVALCLADFRLRGAGWGDILPVLKSVISAALIVGLVMQSRDFWRELSREDLSADTRTGLWFAIAWRLAASMMLVLYHAVDHFAPVTFSVDQYSPVGWPLQIVYYLAVIVVICSTRQVAANRARRQTSVAGYFVVWVLGGVLCSWLVWDMMAWFFNVHVALLGIEMAHPTADFPFLEGIDPLPIQRGAPAFWLGMGAVVLVPLNYVLIYLVARSRGTHVRRTVYVCLFAATFVSMTGLFLWNYAVALPAAAPLIMGTEFAGGVWHAVLIALPVFLTFVTIIAYRWTRQTKAAEELEPAPALIDQATYLHERRWLIGLVTVSVFVVPVSWMVRHFATTRGYANILSDEFMPWYLRIYHVCVGFVMSGDYLFMFGEYAGVLAAFPLLFALLAVSIVLVQGMLGCWRSRHSLGPVQPPELPAKRFAFVWLAVTATTLVSLPVLAIYGFALWLAPWYL